MTSSIRVFNHIVVLTCLLTGAAFTHAAGSGGNDDFEPNTRGLSTEQRSAKAFRAGIKHRDRALKHEARAAKATSEKARAKSLAKAQKEFKKAITKQGEAIKIDPQNYKAANELGFALRRTGDYRKAIGAYNFALEVNPNYHQATEYRGEAFLALGMLQQAQGAYMQLFRNDRALADQLMQRIEEWAAERGDEATEAEAEFIAWAKERRRLAEITADLSMNNTRTW